MGDNDYKKKNKKKSTKGSNTDDTISTNTTTITKVKQSNERSKEARKKKKRDVVENYASLIADEDEDEDADGPRVRIGTKKQSNKKEQKQRNDTEEASAEKKQLTDQGSDTKTEGEGSKPVNLESVSAVKARIRSLKRLLSKKRDTFPDEVVQEKEKEIEKLEASIDPLKKMREKEAKDREVDKRYRMVKFFERRKIRRSIDKIQKQLSSSSEQKSQLEEQLREKYLNLLYIRHYPKGTKYISLFPKEKPSEEAILTQKKIKDEIQKLQSEGKLPTKIEDDNEEDATEEDDEEKQHHPKQKGDKSGGKTGRDGQSGGRQGGKFSKQSTWQSNKRKSDNPFVPSGGEKRAKQSLSTIREDDFFVT